jgi:hypothetical protein
VNGELDSRLHVIKQEILSRDRLTDLITRFDLYPELRARAPMDSVLDQMRRDIEIELNGPEQVSGRKTTVSFKLSYTGASDKTVADVTNALAAFYVAQNANIRSEGRRARPSSERAAECDQEATGSAREGDACLYVQSSRRAAATGRRQPGRPRTAEHAASPQWGTPVEACWRIARS